jgi:hypothetical protein
MSWSPNQSWPARRQHRNRRSETKRCIRSRESERRTNPGNLPSNTRSSPPRTAERFDCRVKMAKSLTISISDVELSEKVTLWEIMRATLRAKEARPSASVLPTILVLKSHEIVAEIFQSCEEPRILLIRTVDGVRKISVNWYDVLLMLYRTSLLTLQKMEGTAVIFFGERTENAGHATLCAMKWTARQFLQQPGRGAKFPETNDSIFQPFCLENEKVRWISDVNTALQFSF